MQQFSGCEPLVGEVVGLRTFRVDESGMLLPLYSNVTWYDGVNLATCAPPTGESSRRPHAVASPDCECGFYAYGTDVAAGRNRQVRFVQAVVSCWGSVVAGTQGVRSEYARIDALWLHPAVPKWVRSRVALTYPSARVYASREAMLAEHPLSVLPCYEPLHMRSLAARLGIGVLAAAVLTLGLLPPGWLAGPVRYAWLGTTVTAAAMALWLLASAHEPGHLAAAAVLAGVLAWLAAPVFGLAGWLLRLPVLRALLVATGGYLRSLRPGYFPVVHDRRERTFCGVRS
ncbi:MAG: hypothetical protein ACRDVG_05575 [Jatrophihabitantaceae bacterium]